MVRREFSLIELLIVIGIMGALLTLVLPGFNDTGAEAKDKVAQTEMREIQSAFRRFAADVVFRKETGDTNQYLMDIAKYGLWPLLWETHPLGSSASPVSSYTEYDSDSGIGRRGPYLDEEGLVTIASGPGVLSTETYGQVKDSEGTVKIPVIKDPYGGYYRVLVPESRTTDGSSLNEYKRLQKIVLVCTGPDKTLDTLPNSFLATTDDGYTSATADDIVAQNDDIVIRLMPLAGY